MTRGVPSSSTSVDEKDSSVSTSIRVSVHKRRSNAVLLESIEIQSVSSLRNAVHRALGKKSPGLDRIRLSIPRKDDPRKALTLDNAKSLAEQDIVDGGVIEWNDLGPQIGWRTVFIVEYFGPPMLYALFAFVPAVRQFIYGSSDLPALTCVQQVLAICFLAHFVKRLAESVFLHSFSHQNMPLANLFLNSWYYWLFGGLIGYSCSHPLFTPADERIFYAGIALFVIGELGNAYSHIILASIRRGKPSSYRAIPTGFLFNRVSSANYTFEILAWIGFSLASCSFWAIVFTVVGAAVMTKWATAKYIRYVKEFGDEFKKRRLNIIFPFIY